MQGDRGADAITVHTLTYQETRRVQSSKEYTERILTICSYLQTQSSYLEQHGLHLSEVE